MTNLEILNRAVAALNAHLYRETATVGYEDDTPYINLMGKRFWCVVKPNLTLGDMAEKNISPGNDAPILYVTAYASPKMLELAKMPEVNILDCAGNFNIQYQPENGNIVMMLANKGEKPIENTTSKAYPLFLEKGLKVIFYLLLNKKHIRHTYREIMDATGVSIGTVKNIFDGLIHQHFLRVEDNKRILTNTERLLTLWAANYGMSLKPKLLHSRFTFRDDQKRKGWKTMKLPDGMMWGGEPAVALTDGFLTPGEFTIYTDLSAATLIKTGAVIPDANGEINVYKKFWADDNKAIVTPAILTYADLIDAANGRCFEAAQKLKENELEYLL